MGLFHILTQRGGAYSREGLIEKEGGLIEILRYLSIFGEISRPLEIFEDS